MGLGELAEQAEQVLARNAEHQALPASPYHIDTTGELAELRAAVTALQAELAPVVALAQQLLPLMRSPKVQQRIAKQLG